MKHCAPLGGIDLLTAKHCSDALSQAGRHGQVKQQPHRFGSTAILRIVQVNPYSFECKSLTALCIVCEKCSQVGIPYGLVMLVEFLPLWALGKWCEIGVCNH